jgi:rhamnogalacturonan endolyase
MKKLIYLYIICSLVITSCNQGNNKVILFSDDYSTIPRGPMGSDLGAHTEYHYLHQAKPKGNWAISTFRNNLPSSWDVRIINKKKVLLQNGVNTNKHWHPMVVAGDILWQDYTIHTSFNPLGKEKQCGIVFRYNNDRCYYLLGVRQDTAFIKMVKHANAYHKPYEIILAAEHFSYAVDQELIVTIELHQNQIAASFENGPKFNISDTTFRSGKIAFLADGPAYFSPIEITTSSKDIKKYQSLRAEMDLEEQKLRDNNPKPVLWKSIQTKDFGVGRNLRFGDLNGDGETDVLIGQVVHHGHKDRNSELSCLTAMTFDGEMLWQKGKPDLWKNHLTNDVAFQIHDIDNDGMNEVVYCMNQMMIVADAKTGETKYKAPTPLTPGGKPTAAGQNIFQRILGDCFYFCDLQGKGYDGDIIIKDRYMHFWAFNSQLELLWKNECVTGHYPYAYDVDEDGKDELMMGYTLFDDDGEKLWTIEESIKDHADGVAIAKFNYDNDPVLLCAASDEGMIFTDMKGNIIKHHYIGHVQNPAIANFRDDKPGMEVVSVNFWGNQGIIHLYDSEGNIYHDFEPNQYGSMCLPLNWTGRSEEFYVLNANVDEGGAYDGWGRKVMDFPDDGHPDMCNAVLDITGDCRDEIVVWDPTEIWVYTQDDNPKLGKLYNPERNELYNYSNYQASVSLQGWNK